VVGDHRDETHGREQRLVAKLQRAYGDACHVDALMKRAGRN